MLVFCLLLFFAVYIFFGEDRTGQQKQRRTYSEQKARRKKSNAANEKNESFLSPTSPSSSPLVVGSDASALLARPLNSREEENKPGAPRTEGITQKAQHLLVLLSPFPTFPLSHSSVRWTGMCRGIGRGPGLASIEITLVSFTRSARNVRLNSPTKCI